MRKRRMLLFVFTAVMVWMLSLTSYAGLVKPSGKKDYHDKQNILKELTEKKTCTLQKGKTYYLNSALLIPSNCTLDATGAVIISRIAAVRNLARKTDYNDLKNVTIIGGTWKSAVKGGYGTGFQFAHASGITMKNMTIINTCYEGHAIELVACKNVVIDNCKVIAQGKKPAVCGEEMIQIDVATKKTAPFLSGKLLNNAGCRDVTIRKCTVKGSRAVGVNFAVSGKGFHKNIKVKDCKLTGLTSEGLALFNTINAEVTGNTIISNGNKLDDVSSVGLHLDILYGNSPWMAKGTYVISGNTIKGGRQALEVYSHMSSKFGKVKITSNKLYCKSGKKNALWADEGSIVKLTEKKNKTYDW